MNGAAESQPRRLYKTSTGLELKRVYTKDDGAGQASLPGEFPYIRGIYPSGYRGKLWTMRMYCGYGTPAETNRRFHYLLKNGQTGLSLAFDLPTQIGLDPDDPRSKGEVGKVGVSVSGLWDFERLFKGIDLGRVSLSMTINATAFILYALYVALARKRGTDLKELRGTVQNDILKEYIARGTYAFPAAPSLRLAADLIQYSLATTPSFYPISVSGYHIRETGATASDEVAFTLGNALAYLDAVCRRGAAVEQVLDRMSFFFGVNNHFLEEIAKFRAARMLWAQLVRERYPTVDPRSAQLRFHAQTCGSTLTKDEPLNNAVRVALQAMAAVMGGAQSLHTNSYDEALSIPTQEAQLLALRTQQVLALETGAADTADPLGGAYAVEALTQDIVHRVRERMKEIEDAGGALRAVETGHIGRILADSSYSSQKEIEAGNTAVIGVNIFRGAVTRESKSFRVRPALERESVAEARRRKSRRSKARAARIIERLVNAASGSENVIPATIEAVEAGGTVGEITLALGKVFGRA